MSNRKGLSRQDKRDKETKRKRNELTYSPIYHKDKEAKIKNK